MRRRKKLSAKILNATIARTIACDQQKLQKLKFSLNYGNLISFGLISTLSLWCNFIINVKAFLLKFADDRPSKSPVGEIPWLETSMAINQIRNLGNFPIFRFYCCVVNSNILCQRWYKIQSSIYCSIQFWSSMELYWTSMFRLLPSYESFWWRNEPFFCSNWQG